MEIVARNIYDPYVAPFAGAPGAGLDCSKDKGKTVQSDAESCDINRIMKRYEKTGALPDMIVRNATYGDFAEVPDFQEALNIVRKAELQFNSLEASIRNRFNNNPAEFLAFVNDPSNMDEMIKMGLAVKKPYDVKRSRVKPDWKPTPEKPTPAPEDFIQQVLRSDWAPSEGKPLPADADYVNA